MVQCSADSYIEQAPQNFPLKSLEAFYTISTSGGVELL